jgi:transketolase
MNNMLDNYNNESELKKAGSRDGFGTAIMEIGANDTDVVVLTANLGGSVRIKEFAKLYPERCIQVGVAEQNMAGIATGLKRYGKKPIITSFAAFNPIVNLSQIRLAALGKQNIKILASHYGLNCGKDGASAQAIEDIGVMKSIPNIVILNPADANQAHQAAISMMSQDHMTYLRVFREPLPVFIDPNSEFIIGKAQKLLEGSDITIIATGSMVYESLQAINILKQNNISAELLNIHTIKPLDLESILTSVQKTGKIVVVEEHNIWGGLGESITRVISEVAPTPIKIIGLEDTYGESGSAKELWQKYGLDRQSIAQKILKFLN